MGGWESARSLMCSVGDKNSLAATRISKLEQ